MITTVRLVNFIGRKNICKPTLQSNTQTRYTQITCRISFLVQLACRDVHIGAIFRNTLERSHEGTANVDRRKTPFIRASDPLIRPALEVAKILCADRMPGESRHRCYSRFSPCFLPSSLRREVVAEESPWIPRRSILRVALF